MTLLDRGDRFPHLVLNVAAEEPFVLPDALAGSYGVVLIYRGAWCPYCNAQLRAFQQAQERLAEVGARVVALSVDDEVTTRALIVKHRLEFPVGHGADVDAVANMVGAFVSHEPHFLQSTGFVLDPAGRVLVSVYSSSAIGRLVPEDVIGLIARVRERAAAIGPA
jgi:peroxiredoxin